MRLKRICQTVDMLQRLRDNALGDIDKSALTWYYALNMDLLLDAGIGLESFEVCAEYALKVIGMYRFFVVVLLDVKEKLTGELF